MSNVLIESQVMTDIASAIREKNGTDNTYLPSEMPQAVKDIEGSEDTGVGSRQWWLDMCSQKTNYASFFQGTDITEAPPIDTSKAVSLINIFNSCKNLVTVHQLDVSKADSLYGNMFYLCSKLVNISFVPGSIKKAFTISACPLLSDESIQSIIDGLTDLTGSESLKVTFHTSVVSRLTQEQMNQIFNKNWSVG